MRLFTTPASPWVRKCTACIIELGIEDRVELHPTLWPHTWATRTVEFDPSFLAATPVGRIPALVTDDGIRLTDSTAICDYLNVEFGEGRLLPPGAEYWRLRSVISIANGLIEAQVSRRAETLRTGQDRSQDFIEKMLRREMRCYGVLDGMVDAFTLEVDLAQLSVAVACDFNDFRFKDDWRSGNPRLSAWFETFVERPSLQRTRPAETPQS